MPVLKSYFKSWDATLSIAFIFWKAKYSDKNWALLYSGQTDDLGMIWGSFISTSFSIFHLHTLSLHFDSQISLWSASKFLPRVFLAHKLVHLIEVLAFTMIWETIYSLKKKKNNPRIVNATILYSFCQFLWVLLCDILSDFFYLIFFFMEKYFSAVTRKMVKITNYMRQRVCHMET